MKIELNGLIKEAMIAKDEAKLKVLRLIKAEFLKFEKAEKAGELTVEKEFEILNKMVKMRRDSVAQYVESKREDLAEIERKEIEVLESYLPKAPTEEEIKEYLEKLVSESKEAMGVYIKKLKEKFPSAEGKKIADLVKSKLQL